MNQMSDRGTGIRYQSTVKCGFYDSHNGDRRYSTSDISSLVSGLVRDGVFSMIGDKFAVSKIRPSDDAEESVKEAAKNTITIGTGKCWFNDTWLENLEPLTIDLGKAEQNFYCVDAVVIDIDKTKNIRDSYIAVVRGPLVASSSAVPPKPSLENGPDRFQHAICYIERLAGEKDIDPENIEYVIGTETPYAHHAVDKSDCPVPFGMWYEQLNAFVAKAKVDFEEDKKVLIDAFNEWYNSTTASINGHIEELDGWIETEKQDFQGWRDTQEAGFEAWFAKIQTNLSGDVAGNLQNEIDETNEKLGKREIECMLMNGLPGGSKTFSEDGTVITSTDENNALQLVKTFSSDFSKCTTVLTEAGIEIGKLIKTFNSDGSTSSEITIN